MARQRDLVFRVFLDNPGQCFDAASVAREMQLAGHPERRRRVPTIRAVLSRLRAAGALIRIERGQYMLFTAAGWPEQ